MNHFEYEPEAFDPSADQGHVTPAERRAEAGLAHLEPLHLHGDNWYLGKRMLCHASHTSTEVLAAARRISAETEALYLELKRKADTTAGLYRLAHLLQAQEGTP